MEYVEARGLRLSRLTLGTVQLGMDYGIANTAGKPDFERSAALLDAAAAGGINSFDTAAAYGDSEAVLGRYFAGRPAGAPDPLIITKMKTGAAQPLDRGRLLAAVRASVEGSLARLRRGRVEALMLHSAADLLLHGEAIVRAMEDVRDEGLAGRIGVSVYTSREADEALRYSAFDAVQIPVNVMDTRFSQSGALERLKAAGIIVFVRSVFLQGLFFRDPDTLPAGLSEAGPYLRILREAARIEGMTVAQLAFGHVRDLPGVTSLVVGAETADQVRENLRLFEAPSISGETAAWLRESFNGVPERVLNPHLWP